MGENIWGNNFLVSLSGDLKWNLLFIVNLRDFERMDTNLLVGLVNTELRNACESLEDLVKTHNLSEEALIEKLAGHGFRYVEELRQFR